MIHLRVEIPSPALDYARLTVLVEGGAGEPRACLNSWRVVSQNPARSASVGGLGLWQKDAVTGNYFLQGFKRWFFLPCLGDVGGAGRRWRSFWQFYLCRELPSFSFLAPHLLSWGHLRHPPDY